MDKVYLCKPCNMTFESIPIFKTHSCVLMGDTDASVAPTICFRELTTAPTSPYKGVVSERKDVGVEDNKKRDSDTEEEYGACCCAAGEYFGCPFAESCEQFETTVCTLICCCESGCDCDDDD